MKVVIDSSVLISAFRSAFRSKNSPPVVLLALGRQGAFSLFLSPRILAETTAGILNPKKNRGIRFVSGEVVREFCKALGETATLIEELPDIVAVPRDPKDDHIVACAVAAEADCLVTGDDHMLSLGQYRGIRIVTPRQFLDFLRSRAAG